MVETASLISCTYPTTATKNACFFYGCWAHARRKFVEALDEDRKHASEALVYIGRLYGIEKEMQEAGLDAEAIRKR